MASIMEREIINNVCVNDARELLLMLEGGGKSMYQYVYRAAAGVLRADLDSGRGVRWSQSEGLHRQRCAE